MRSQNILIVEDNPTHQRILAILAEQAGITAHIMASAREALDALGGNSEFALVLMDWRLADIDGLECAREIRRRELVSGRRVPIVAVTAHAMMGDREKCLEAGMDDYLSKPFTARQVHQLLNRWVAAAADRPREATDQASDQAGAYEFAGQSAPRDLQCRAGT
jgi:CheY-like chemotaxis protein